jgi:hypothetical protein
MSSIVVTGASSGIGLACVQSAIAQGWHAFASVRSRTDADMLQQTFGGNVTPLIMDVCDGDSIVAAAATVANVLGTQRLQGLVNNAGVAVAGPLLHIPLAEVRRQFDINFFGQLAVIQAFAPLLGSDRHRTGTPGRIINISSIGGKIGGPYLGPYVASKHALEGLSESLRRELLMFGIDVIIVGPGAIATPIWRKAEQLDIAQYAQTAYGAYVGTYHAKLVAQGIHGLPAARVGNLVMHALTTAHPQTRYALAPNLLLDWWLPRWLPTRWVDRIVARAYGLPDHPMP